MLSDYAGFVPVLCRYFVGDYVGFTRNQARDQTRVSKEPAGLDLEPAGLDFKPAGLELKPVGLELEPAGLEFGPKLA